MENICATCNEAIQGKCVQALGKNFHPDHFCCTDCNELLTTVYNRENQPVCKDCATKQLRTCKSCEKAIYGQFIRALDALWHPDCLICTKCQTTLGGSFFQREGNPYCTDCFNDTALRCASCDKEILDQVCQAMGKSWHVSCFTCSVCKEPFTGKKIFEKGGKPYCEEHLISSLGTASGSSHNDSETLRNDQQEDLKQPEDEKEKLYDSPLSKPSSPSIENKNIQGVDSKEEDAVVEAKDEDFTKTAKISTKLQESPLPSAVVGKQPLHSSADMINQAKKESPTKKRIIPPRRSVPTPPPTKKVSPNSCPPTPERPPDRKLARRLPPSRNKTSFRHSCAITQSPAGQHSIIPPYGAPNSPIRSPAKKRPPPPPPRRTTTGGSQQVSRSSRSSPSSPNTLKKSKSDPRIKKLAEEGKKRLDSSNTSPFRTLKRILQLALDALDVDEISRARIEEILSNSLGFQSLKHQRSISLKQESEIKKIILIVEAMISASPTQ